MYNMNDLYKIKPNRCIFLEKFDNPTNCVENTINYISYDIEPFKGSVDSINKRLNDYLNR